MKAYDLLVQCESGLDLDYRYPGCTGPGWFFDLRYHLRGTQAYIAILEALIERQHSGEGCVIQVSLFDSMAEWMAVPLLHYDYAGTIQSTGRD